MPLTQETKMAAKNVLTAPNGSNSFFSVYNYHLPSENLLNCSTDKHKIERIFISKTLGTIVRKNITVLISH